jgi:uncharacterized protein YgbK (DUF1537 family)
MNRDTYKKQIQIEIAEENLAIGGKMLELAEYLNEYAKNQIEVANEWVEKAEASENKYTAQTYEELAEYTLLEADENNRLSILLSKKAMKLCDEVESFMGD